MWTTFDEVHIDCSGIEGRIIHIHDSVKMKGGSFADLEDAKPRGGTNGVAARKNVNGFSASNGANGASAGGNGAAGPLNNYSTFHGSDPSVQSLLRTSDQIEASKRVIADSEEIAKNVMVDLELQRSQLQDMKGMVHENISLTGEAKSLLQIIADRSYRRKVFLWCIIIALAITDIVVFYLLFLRR